MSDKLIMCYDTETSGLPDFKAAYDAPHQPNLIQLGFKVFNRNRDVIFEIGHLVDSTVLADWRGIDPGAYAVHKISEETIQRYGFSPDRTIKAFQYWAEKCDIFFGHNEQFDCGVMQRAAKRSGFSPDLFSTGTRFCTMMSTINICKVPNASRAGWKWPKLIEAYQHLFGRDFGNAHNALADVNATGDIFWECIDRGFFRIEGDQVVKLV